ncbi:MAG: hypothetical protein ACKV22_15470 [Bryobacteraceae bacterium]
MEPSLWHLTLNTGHSSKSLRTEVDENIVEIVSQRLADDAFDLPGGYRCVLTHRTSKSFEAELQTKGGAKLVSMGFAAEPSTGAAVWDRLVAADEPQPPTVPWLAIRLHQGLAGDTTATSWLDDFERCLAWAFLDRCQRSSAQPFGYWLARRKPSARKRAAK